MGSKHIPRNRTAPGRRRAASCTVAACALLGVLCTGCNRGEQLWPVSGKVTFQGKAVSDATVRFSNPRAGVDLTAKLDTHGVYTVVMAQGKGMPAGTYQVAVIPAMSETPLGPIQQVVKAPERPDIPQRYRSPNTSGLALVLPAGDNPFDFDMQP